MSNPYRGLDSYHFWRPSVATVAAHQFDPVVKTRFAVAPTARVATAGSCFAQHISRKLVGMGFNYYVTEPGEGLSSEARTRGQYGLFSARYGNIYTSRQLRQLAEEVLGQRRPDETAWRMSNGRFADPYRPSVEPDGFTSVDALLADRGRHLSAVRDMLEHADVFIFTLGLTETWRSRRDGSVFPVAPGVLAGGFDPKQHEFVNLTVDDVMADMRSFLSQLRAINPKVRAILTVSPVPLNATMEDRSVVVSTIYSKSVLRVAADMLYQEHDFVEYFPSYEIIVGSQAGGLYYRDDCREVNDAGVAHAMRVFERHYAEQKGQAADRAPARSGAESKVRAKSSGEIICDEEAIDAVRQANQQAAGPWWLPRRRPR